MVPDHSWVVRDVNRDNPSWLPINSETTILAFMQEVGRRLVALDSNWGYLSKTGGEKHLTLPDGRFISVDSFIYRSTDEVIDTIGNALDQGAAYTAWQPQPKRPNNNWTPIESAPGPGPGPTPPSDTELARRVATLERELAILKDAAVLYGQKIGLRMDGGKIICVESGGPEFDHQQVVLTSRSAVGPWESLEVERGV